MANEFVSSIQTLNLSATSIKKMTGWPDMMTNDYLTNLSNFLEIANKSDVVLAQVDANTAGIQNNADDIQNNKDDINVNADDIIIVADDLLDHENLNSAHGVTGSNVGTGDFANPSIGGVVLLASLISDLTAIATADLLAAPAAYNQAYTQLSTALTNENKAKINEIVSKVNAIISGQITAQQMAAI